MEKEFQKFAIYWDWVVKTLTTNARLSLQGIDNQFSVSSYEQFWKVDSMLLEPYSKTFYTNNRETIHAIQAQANTSIGYAD